MWPVESRRSSIRWDTRGLGMQRQLLCNLATGEISKCSCGKQRYTTSHITLIKEPFRAVFCWNHFQTCVLIPLPSIPFSFVHLTIPVGYYRWGISCSKSFLRGSRALPREPWTKAGAQTDSNRPSERETQASSWKSVHATSPRIKSKISLSSFLCCLQSRVRVTQKQAIQCCVHNASWGESHETLARS